MTMSSSSDQSKVSEWPVTSGGPSVKELPADVKFFGGDPETEPESMFWFGLVSGCLAVFPPSLRV
jgi:hypothetical protein